MAEYDGSASADEKESAPWLEWLGKVQARERDFKDSWWKPAEAAAALYDQKTPEQGRDDPQPYNILYSNTEVLLPSLYSSTPKPDVRTRFKGEGDKALPTLVERLLIIATDPADPGTEDLDSAMAESVLCSLVPGMGFIRLRRDDSRAVPISYEAGHFKGLLWGKARKWSKVPWVAFRYELTKSEFQSKFQIPEGEMSNYSEPESEDKEDKNAPGGCLVYEVWDKASRKIYFLSPNWKKTLIQEGEDELGLQGFFPTPGPLCLTKRPGKLEPVPLFEYYRNQAQELNRVTVRLNKVLSAIRVRGAYSSLMGTDMEKLLHDTEMENALVPASESALLSMNGGFDRMIWMLPIEKLITVAQQLYVARQQIKQVIYELTGISDIIRGASVASETATAQDLKNKWGTIRLRKMQTIVANYVRDLYRLTVDAAVGLVPPIKWKEVTQSPLPTNAEKQALQQQIQPQVMQLQQLAASGQQVQPPPQLIQAMQKLQSPSIEDLLARIKTDANRTYVINVQANSTIDLDTAQDKEEVAEFMNSMGQLVPALSGFVQLGPSGLEAAKAILMGVCQRFKFGLEIADVIAKIQPPPMPQKQDPELEKRAKEVEQKEKAVEQQTQQLKDLETKLQDLKREIEVARKEFAADQKVAQIERQAQDKVVNAAMAAHKASLGAIEAKQQAGATQRKADLIAFDAKRNQQQIQQQAAQEATVQNEGKVEKLVAPLSEAVMKLQEGLMQLQEIVAKAQQKPKRLVKQDGAWVPEY